MRCIRFLPLLLLLLALPATLTAAVVVTGQSATVPFSSTSWAGLLSSTDLVNAGQSTLAGATVSAAHGSFPGGGVNDGATTDFSVPGGNTFFHRADSHFPATVTFDLDVAAHPLGYDLTSIQAFLGWATVSNTQANQTYTVEVRLVGAPAYVPLTTVSYAPFQDVQGGNYETRVAITESVSGVLASGVESIRFTFADPLLAVADGAGSIEGSLVREIDVFGAPTGSGGGGPAAAVSIASPKARQIIQRGAGGTASVAISGGYTGAPDSIEARMVVMAGGGNSGTGTAWTTIATAPTGGTFSGTLGGVPAGGWYQLEVRAVTGGAPGSAATLARVGIGDIYITCGQSNSANYGSPAATVSDDRVSAWNHTNGAWTKAADPMPGADGGGGSAWTRLGDLLAARDNVPVAFACLGVGSTSVEQWTPAAGLHFSRVQTAVTAFPPNGFRAVLWHQGESDAIAGTTPTTYQSRLQSIISQSRAVAGWTVPWIVAEAAFHPATSLTQEDPVLAGQRLVIHADPQVFPGPATDDFHLEGKLNDTVHFNAAGLADHAAQWADVLGGSPALAPKNADFESNAALADGAAASTDTGATSSPSVIAWRALAAAGNAPADGSHGYYNPTDAAYPGSTDGGASGGVAPAMSGRHVAFLSGSAVGAHFLQTRRALLAPGTTYTLTVALGVRATAETFGGAVLELLADGTPLASRTLARADLDAVQGGSASGKFTDVALSVTTGTTVAPGQALAIRIVKPGGAGTYLDLDNVRLTSALMPFAAWQVDHWASTTTPPAAWTADPDGDSLPNAIEYYLGLDPLAHDPQSFLTSSEHDGKSWQRFEIPLDPAVNSAGLGLWYSFDLATWQPAASDPGGTIIEQRAAAFWFLEISATDHPRAFFRLLVGAQPE